MINALWSKPEAHAAGWQIISLRFQNPSHTLLFLVDSGDGTRPDTRATLTGNVKTGEIERVETFSSFNAGRKIRMWMRPIHTGEAGGILGQTIAAGTAFSAAVLVWTGSALAWRRFFRRKPSVPAREPAEELAVVGR